MHDWDPQAALIEFNGRRPPGIYKGDYITDLFERYGDVADAPAVPDLPDWCYEEESAENNGRDDDGNEVNEHDTNNRLAARNRRGKIPVFMEGVPGVEPILDQPMLGRLQRRFQELCLFRRYKETEAEKTSNQKLRLNQTI